MRSSSRCKRSPSRSVFVAVGVGNAAPGRAKGRAFFCETILFQSVLHAVPRHRDRSLVGKFQVFRADGDAALLNGCDLVGQVVQVNDHAGAQNTNHMGVQNARGQQVQHEFALLGHDGMACVVAALIAGDNVSVFCQQVNDAAFALIAPVDAGNCC